MPAGSAPEIAMQKIGERIASALERLVKLWEEDMALKRQYAASMGATRKPSSGELVDEDEAPKPPPISTPKPSRPTKAPEPEPPASNPLGLDEEFVPGTRDRGSWGG